MSATDTKRGLADVPEAAVITLLLNEVKRTPNLPSPAKPGESTGLRTPLLPSPGFAVEGTGGRAAIPFPPSPLPQTPERAVASGVVPVGALTVADFFALVNWKNRPEDAKPLPAVTPERSPGHEWTVGAVMSAFLGD